MKAEEDIKGTASTRPFYGLYQPLKQPNEVEQAVLRWQRIVAAVYTGETGKLGPPTQDWREKHNRTIKLILNMELQTDHASEPTHKPGSTTKLWVLFNPHLLRAPIAYMACFVCMVVAFDEVFIGTWGLPVCGSLASCGGYFFLRLLGIALLSIPAYFGTWLIFEGWVKARVLTRLRSYPGLLPAAANRFLERSKENHEEQDKEM